MNGGATRFFVLFLALLAGLFFLELTPWVQAHLVDHWTGALATFSARLITFFDSGVVAYDNVILSQRSGFGVSILPGCNGVEACVVLIAAVTAYPATVRDKLFGILAGCLAVQALNVLRVISLFYLGQWNREVFDWAHRYIWGTLIMLDVMVVWLLWVRSIQARTRAAHGA